MLLIDAFNVLHAAPNPQIGLQGLTLATLIRLIASSRWASRGVTLVCDGSGGRSAVPEANLHPDAPIRVIFAGPGKDADSVIERLIIDAERRAGAAGGSGLTIVSSDKRVLAAAIGPVGPKARRLTSKQFLQALIEDARRSGEADPARPDALSKESVADWVRRFGAQAPGAKEPTQAPGPESRPSQKPEDWPEGIDPDDLDMRKWLKE